MTIKKTYRYKLLLDEMLPKRNRFPLLNNYHDLKHIVHDFKKSGITDYMVVQLAQKEKRIIISKNARHFRSLCRKHCIDLISFEDTIPFEYFDKKANAYLRKRSTHKMTGSEKKIIL